MNDQVIIFTSHLGGVAMCVPTGEVPIEVVQRKDIPAGVESFIVQRSDLPMESMDFFTAWEQSGGVVTINLEKAKEITRERLRFDRKALLTQQDVLFQRAMEENKDTSAIVAEKQRLRDLPTLADACTTLDELRALKAEA